MRRYIYMLFLACGLFDTSSGASSSSEAAPVQASPEEQEVRDAFAEFDRACEEYYTKASPRAQESIYVDKLFEEYKTKDDDDPVKQEQLRMQKENLQNIQDYYKNLNLELKEVLELYAKVTEAENRLDRLSKDPNPKLVDAFYAFVEKRYNDKRMPDLISKVTGSLKRLISIQYCDLFNDFIKGDLELYKSLHKNELLEYKTLEFDNIEMNSADIDQYITKCLLPEKDQKAFKNNIDEDIGKQNYRNKQSIDEIRDKLVSKKTTEDLIESLKEQKEFMPVWEIRRSIYGFFISKLEDMPLLSLIEEYPFDIMNIYDPFAIHFSSIYQYQSSRPDFVRSGYFRNILGIEIEPASYTIVNNHKIDSDLRLHGWFVEAEGRRT